MRTSVSAWPKSRDTHSSCVITSGAVNAASGETHTTSHLCIMGGSDGPGGTLGDCWLYSFKTKLWNKVSTMRLYLLIYNEASACENNYYCCFILIIYLFGMEILENSYAGVIYFKAGI